MKKGVLFLTTFFVFLSCFSVVKAVSSLDIVINEVAWMGTVNSANDEWVELYNNTGNNINLDGWLLKSEDGTPEIELIGLISANGFFLLERTDDETVPGVASNQIYKGALGNNGENLKLFDGSGNLIDQINCSSGWFSGDNKTKQTMERISSLAPGNDTQNWQTSQNTSGTPKTKNSIVLAETLNPTTETPKTEEEKPAEDSSPLAINYPEGVVFNEILPSPEGSDETEEWIEIFNQNSFEVNLSEWKIKDSAGKITTYTFPAGTKIASQGFLVLPRPETKITLNNDEDGLILSSPDGKIVDEVNYTKASQGQSYNKVENNWVWSISLTPGAPNIVEKTEARPLEDKEEKELAAVGEPFRQAQDKQVSKLLFPFLIALAIAVLSGIIILILKKKLKNKV